MSSAEQKLENITKILDDFHMPTCGSLEERVGMLCGVLDDVFVKYHDIRTRNSKVRHLIAKAAACLELEE